MPCPVGLSCRERELRLAVFYHVKSGFDKQDGFAEVVVDVVGSKAQDRIPVGDGRVLLGPVSLKGHAVFVVFPAIDFHKELSNPEIKAVPSNESIVFWENSFSAQLSA